jgi:sugar phosphate isomerase/epimerase
MIIGYLVRKIGVAQWCLDRNGPEALYRAAELGLSALHIDAEESGLASVRQAYLRAARETGVEITAIGINAMNDWEPAGFQAGTASEKAWAAIRAAIEAADLMKVRLVYLPSFERAEIRTKGDLARTADALRMACDYARVTPVMIATENTLGLDDNLRLVQTVNDARLRVLIDSLNPVLWGHDMPSLIEGLWPFLCDQFHAKDGRHGAMGNCPLDQGEAKFAATAATLQRLGFTGDVILENEYGQCAKQRLAEDIATVKRVLDFG